MLKLLTWKIIIYYFNIRTYQHMEAINRSNYIGLIKIKYIESEQVILAEVKRYYLNSSKFQDLIKE